MIVSLLARTSHLKGRRVGREGGRKETRPELILSFFVFASDGRGFSLRCRQYWAGEDAYRPPWCSPLAWMVSPFPLPHLSLLVPN